MQSRTRLQGRWNGIFSMECGAGLNNKAGGMDFSLECTCRAGLDGMELSLKYRAELNDKACGMEFLWSVTQDWTKNTDGMEFSLGCQAGLDKECSQNGILLGVLSRVG